MCCPELIFVVVCLFQVFCGKIPRDMYEDELIPLFEKCGKIWDLRLMMDPMTGQNRGYAFITFTNRDSAQQAVREVGGPRFVNISLVPVSSLYNYPSLHLLQPLSQK